MCDRSRGFCNTTYIRRGCCWGHPCLDITIAWARTNRGYDSQPLHLVRQHSTVYRVPQLSECSNWPTVNPVTGRPAKTQAISLGLGSLFNHSTQDQNVGWERSLNTKTITYIALRDISLGEELCINYGRVWFHDSDAAQEEEEDCADVMLGRLEIDLWIRLV